MAFKNLILSIFLIGSFGSEVKANNHSLEDNYREIGYQSVSKALYEFENHYSAEMNLPARIPSIKFTHVLGRFNDLEGGVNDSFEVQFLSERFPENHYKIEIRPKKYKIEKPANQVLKTVELTDGNEGCFIKVPGFHVLVFEKGNWQYMLSLDKRINKQASADLLVKIAESVEDEKGEVH